MFGVAFFCATLRNSAVKIANGKQNRINILTFPAFSLKNSHMKRFANFFALFAILTQFGCVGTDISAPKTPANVSDVNGLRISHDFLDDNEYNRRRAVPAPFREIRTVTIHNTAGYISAKVERDRINSKRDNVSVSFHYAVDENWAVQLIPLNMHAWHAGDGDMYSISIEICRSLCRDGDAYERSEANAVILAAHLLNQYNLTVDSLRMHRDWSGKYCPHRILERNGWEDFKKRVAAEMQKAR